MPTHPPIEKILVIGAGPVRIGQPGAFDDAACRACETFVQAGLQTVMVHCDPSALSADAATADRTYMVPLTVAALTEVVLREKPDALLPTVGGPDALKLAKALLKSGLLEAHGIRLLGASEKALTLIDDPSAFALALSDLGLAAPAGQSAASVADAAAIAEKIGYPVFVRVAERSGHQRYGVAYNVEEMRMLAAGAPLPSDRTGVLWIEPALPGFREVEVEMLRDGNNRMQLVGMAENMDPVGIHSGDSAAVVPPISIGSQARRQIEAAAFKLAEYAGVTGAMHLKFALGPDTEPVQVLAMDPRFSRMSALFTKAFDIPLGAIHARLALEADLEDVLQSEGSRITDAMAGGTIAVRLPRWEFERFPGEALRLDARMRSTGEVLGLGRHFMEALQKAHRSLSPRHPLIGLQSTLVPLTAEDLMHKLVVPAPDRLPVMLEALKKGVALEEIAAVTGIGLEWIRQIADLASLESRLGNLRGEKPPASLIAKAAAAGFGESALSCLLGITTDAAAGLLADANVRISPQPAGNDGQSRVWLHTTAGGHAHHRPLIKAVLIVGPGSGRIGRSIELDHCCVHGARALQAAGRKVILVNANPSAACGPGDADRTYIEPLTAADLTAVCRTEHPEGVILQFGGYGAMDMAGALADAGFSVLGTACAVAVLSQDRLRFSALLTDMGIPHPQRSAADTPEAALDAAETIGYPLVASPQADREGRRRTIIMDARMMEKYVMKSAVSIESPIMLEQFLEYAIEVEADALCDGRSVYVPAVMEHIELAGVHSGDAALVVPPYSTPPRHIETIGAYIHKIALELQVKGVLNTRFAVYNDTVYLLEARPWASRTLPLVSKIVDVPMAERAVEIMLGMTLDAMDLPRRLLPHYGIRASVFPFDVFTRTDPLLGPRMRSTGQVLAMADVFGMAYFNSQEAAGPPLPLQGNVLITVTDADKPSILEPARLFTEMGFGILATRGTHAFLQKNGIDAQLVKKLGFGRPDLVDAIKTGDVDLVVNTPSGSQSQMDDAYIRNTAIRYHIPNITTPAGALAAAKGIAARKRGQDALCTLQSYVRAVK